MMEEMRVQVNIQMEKSLRYKIRKAAIEEEITVSDLIREAIAEHLERLNSQEHKR